MHEVHTQVRNHIEKDPQRQKKQLIGHVHILDSGTVQ